MDERRRLGPAIGGIVGLAAIALIVFATRSAGPSDVAEDAPLAAPVEPEITTTIPSPRPITPSDTWRLVIQTPGVLWEIDVATGEMTRLVDPAGDSVPRGGDLVVMRTGGIALAEDGSSGFIPADGDIVLIEPDGDEYEFETGLPWQRPLLPVEQSPRFALTPRPVALVPVTIDDGLVLRRAALDGSSHDDVPLPGCGVAHPIAAAGNDRAFGVWCRDSDDLRLFYDDGSGLVEIRVDEIRGDGLMPALLARGDKPLLVDPFGGVWGFSLFDQAFTDEERPIAGRNGMIPIADDERILGITAISTDFEHIVVGVSSGDDFDRSPTASRLAGFDPLGFGDDWSTVPPVDVVSLVGAPGGRIFGLGQDERGGVLMSIDPVLGSVEIVHTGLPVDHGRLMVLG